MHFVIIFTRHPTGGSFVRPKKVDFGISIFEALKQRYGQGGDSINEEDMYVMSGNNRWKAVEMVGADSIQQKQRYLILDRTYLILCHAWFAPSIIILILSVA